MIVDRDDLGLSLSLSCSKTTSNNKSMKQKKHCPVQLKSMPCLQSSLWSAADGAEEEEGGVSSANSTVSCLSGKPNGGELDNDRRGMSEEEEEDGDAARKKLRLSKEQSAVLEDSFKENHTLNPKQKVGLARRLGVRPRQVEVWFQNRRARTKLKQTELDCELMKKWCSQLAEENRRLHKEIQKLRALNHLSPQFYMTTPATTLTMCPSCHNQRRSPVQPIHR